MILRLFNSMSAAQSAGDALVTEKCAAAAAVAATLSEWADTLSEGDVITVSDDD